MISPFVVIISVPPHSDYVQQHKEVNLVYGPAKGYLCVSCEKPAFHWALKPEYVCPEMYGLKGFVKDVTAYQPMCPTCHYVQDRKGVKYKKTGPHSAEARAKMSRSQLGRILSEEHRKKLSRAQTGKSHSQETKEKIRRSVQLRYLI